MNMNKILLNGNIIPIRKNTHSILENIELNNQDIRFQCRNGICGSCRCKLISGEFRYQKPKIGNTSSSEILICIAVATSNLILEQGLN